MRVAVVVAHPDDETLWAGGTILSHPEWECFVACLCRASDPDRAPRFFRALRQLGASGNIAALDDPPDQNPLPSAEVQREVLRLLPESRFDLVLTHGPKGEYTRHRRHEEAGSAVRALWQARKISTEALWLFAYDDGCGRHRPRAASDAHLNKALDEEIWRRKYAIITETYGFEAQSFEARTSPREEAFWCFQSPHEMLRWMTVKGENT